MFQWEYWNQWHIRKQFSITMPNITRPVPNGSEGLLEI